MNGLVRNVAVLGLLVAGSLSGVNSTEAQTRAQLERQYADECSRPTDDPDVLASCDILAKLIGAKRVEFSGDYPVIPPRKNAGFATNLKLSLYSQNCSIPRPIATPQQCDEWRRDIEQSYSELDFPKRPKSAPLQPTDGRPAPRCTDCPTGRAR